jgi:prophage regulatory protein
VRHENTATDRPAVTVNELQRFLRWNQLKQVVPFSRVTIWRWVREGMFPKPVHLGKRGTAWIAAEIEQWIAERAEARNA